MNIASNTKMDPTKDVSSTHPKKDPITIIDPHIDEPKKDVKIDETVKS